MPGLKLSHVSTTGLCCLSRSMAHTNNAFQIHIQLYWKASQLQSTINCDLLKQLQSWYVRAQLTVDCNSRSLIFKLVIFSQQLCHSTSILFYQLFHGKQHQGPALSFFFHFVRCTCSGQSQQLQEQIYEIRIFILILDSTYVQEVRKTRFPPCSQRAPSCSDDWNCINVSLNPSPLTRNGGNKVISTMYVYVTWRCWPVCAFNIYSYNNNPLQMYAFCIIDSIERINIKWRTMHSRYCIWRYYLHNFSHLFWNQIVTYFHCRI